ncbi:hypothetical protein KGF54_002524 [Candida jiufengensis]|uniref:uncharacterized protein n=1 Tax=Candida jiufengensis TaxID=497108 RepID=UPI0022257098|nr:uncharacterized protein KGF54_002524 [Candida jiufengensis]KAI5953153.1 hypothetical protein KGF54_002524 [Candida jiufengensis]
MPYSNQNDIESNIPTSSSSQPTQTSSNIPRSSTTNQPHHNNNYNNNHNNYNTNDQTMQQLPPVPEDPFRNIHISTYSHSANTYPPYVLDAIYKKLIFDEKHHIENPQQQQFIELNEKDLEKNNNGRSLEFKAIDDPYYVATDGDVRKFFENIKTPIAEPPGKINIDPSILNEYDFSKPWGGDERLKKEFNDSNLSNKQILEDSQSKSWWSYFSRTKDDGEHDTKFRRTTAGYWMGGPRSQARPAIKHFLLNGPLIPLMLRIITLMFCAIALGLACTIFVFSNDKYFGRSVKQQPSTIMAITVQSCALLYVIYIAYDEYAGKPLGLRKPMSKLRLILLDLLFIIFSAANLSLAFNTLYDDEWVCEIYRNPAYQDVNNYFPVVSSICRRQRALASFLFVILVTWVLTFTISLLRVIDKVNTKRGP